MTELINIQSKLKAPKNQYNSFGKYKYRNCEDILEALKPLLEANKCVLLLSDKIVEITGRHYVEATATIINSDGKELKSTAVAREEETKKGMDASQITGSTSSYARKYALNGLFAIDDTKDADILDNSNKENNTKKQEKKSENNEENIDLVIAIQEIKEAKTIPEMIGIWNRWECFHTNKQFSIALSNRKSELKK